MWVLAVESLTKIDRAIAETLKPRASRLSTSDSRCVSCGPAGVIRRRIAPARSAAVKDRGETMAWRAAATTSSAGASLATKADAPASRAANSCSSPAYMVSTTIPVLWPWSRKVLTSSSPVPSGSRTSVMTTSGSSVANNRRPSATEAACPHTSKSSWPSNARARPCRIRSWSSIRSTREVCSVMSCAFESLDGLGGNLNADHGPTIDCSAGGTVDVERRVDASRPFSHDRDAVGVVSPAHDAAAVVADRQAGLGRVGPAVDPEVLGGGVLAGVGDRLLGDPQQLSLDGWRQAGGCLVEGEVDSQVGLRADLAHVVRQSRPEAV